MKLKLAIAGLVLLVAVPVTGHAQCAVGCVSSSSCDGSGKSGCKTMCNGNGYCGCGDTVCDTQLLPVTVGPDGGSGPVLVSGTDDSRPAVALLVDCHGNVLDVRLASAEGVALLDEVVTIHLYRPREARVRMAARE